jgi:transposase-like protein
LKPRRSDLEVLRALLEAAKKLIREPYTITELAAAAGITRKTVARWIRILKIVAEVLVLPLETKRNFEGPGRGRRRSRKRLTTVSLALT